ncbi:DUF835 domain-containing protein [Thermococcus sp. 21S7]|uniref:DUF835 domain-containing protein n=1 Tax=Thermococcus sp. 21S7 TaxID=1638221 RepID=UPI001438B91A|nr:DUF835 domain-containing protein [Thermococcus sp. 21S7]NJE62433.1 DUF835 domain-containing protein [Thermococcus sp. 21S7]
MGIHNLGGLIAGLIILVISLITAYKSYGYLKKLETPLARKLALTVFVSAILAIIGSLGTSFQSTTGANVWWIMATFFTGSYTVIIMAVFLYLDLLYRATTGEFGRGTPKELRKSPPLPDKKQTNPVLPSGAFTVPPEHMSGLRQVCKFATSTLYVGRKPDVKWCQFDDVIWITRINAPNSINPSKLHVLQDEIMHFVSRHGEGSLIILCGVDHLILYNEFKSVVKFLTIMKDYMILTNSTLIVVIDEKIFDESQMAILRKELPPLEWKKIAQTMGDAALFGAIAREELRHKTAGISKTTTTEDVQEESTNSG